MRAPISEDAGFLQGEIPLILMNRIAAEKAYLGDSGDLVRSIVAVAVDHYDFPAQLNESRVRRMFGASL